MGPELLVQMFDTFGNVTMVKESTGDLSRMHGRRRQGQALAGGDPQPPHHINSNQGCAAEATDTRAITLPPRDAVRAFVLFPESFRRVNLEKR